MKDDAVYLTYILECIRRIEEDAAPGREQFLARHTLQDAVLRNLQVGDSLSQAGDPSHAGPSEPARRAPRL
jgi:uncharacterized protein with HEPN domain